MIVCPDCGFENIDGADLCETCQQPLAPLNAPTPTTDIEKSIFHDRIRSLARAWAFVRRIPYPCGGGARAHG